MAGSATTLLPWVALLASCVSPPSWGDAPVTAASDALNDSMAMTLAAELPPMLGRFRVLHAPDACRSAIVGQGNPLVSTDGFPMPGRPLHIEWTVNPTEPYEDDRPAFVLMWFDSAEPFDLTPHGQPGCHLWAPPDPRHFVKMLPRDGGILRQDGGRISLNWTPGPQWAGRKIYTQLVVMSPGANALGWLLSPGLECWVGVE
jgi:hypothetical protein